MKCICIQNFDNEFKLNHIFYEIGQLYETEELDDHIFIKVFINKKTDLGLIFHKSNFSKNFIFHEYFKPIRNENLEFLLNIIYK